MKRFRANFEAVSKGEGKFPIGRLIINEKVLSYTAKRGINVSPFVERHHRGDWGACCPSDAKMNDWCIDHDGLLLSIYYLPDGRKIWVKTEEDRSVTTVLFPEDN